MVLHRIVLSVLILFNITFISLLSAQGWEIQYQTGGNIFYHTDFSNPQTGWAVGFEGIILHTNDGGLTWNEQSSNTNKSLYGVHFINDKKGWAIGENGTIITTNNGGQKWTPIKALGINEEDLLRSVFFISDKIGWASSDRTFLYKTYDGGVSWEKQIDLVADDQRIYEIFFINENIGWACGDRRAMYRTTNGGDTWIPVDRAQLSTNLYESIYFINKNIGWAAGANGTILKSFDGGVTWSSQQLTPRERLMKIQFFEENTGIVISTNGKTWKTSDGGTNWDQAGTALIAPNIADMIFTNENEGWAVSAVGGIAQTKDGGETWQTQISNNREFFYGVYSLDSKTSYIAGWKSNSIGTFDGTVLKTINGGKDWEPLETGVIPSLNEVFFLTEDVGWVSGVDGAILKTEDGGENWITQESGVNGTIFSIQFIDDHVGWATGWTDNQRGIILGTSDGGSSWDTLAFDSLGINVYDLSFISADTLWSCGPQGNLFHSRDGGQSWIQQTVGNNEDYLSIDFIDANTGWAVSNQGSVIRTINGGNQWEIVDFPAVDNDLFYKVDFLNFNTGWISGSKGIYKTIDGGENWEFSETLAGEFNLDFSFVNENEGWIASFFGNIFHFTERVVSNTNDSGPGSLRNALSMANAEPGFDTLRFNIPGDGPHVISPLTPLPPISDGNIAIDASTQPDFEPGMIVLSGDSIQVADQAALTITSDSVLIKGLTITNWSGGGIVIENVQSISITQNDISFSDDTGILINSSSDILVANNQIHEHNIGLATSTSSNVLITENTFTCNTTTAIQRNGDGPEPPVVLTTALNQIRGTADPGTLVEIYLIDNQTCPEAACQGGLLLGTAEANAVGDWILQAPYSLPIELESLISLNGTSPEGNTSAFVICSPFLSDECIDAFELPVNAEACTGNVLQTTNAGATASDPPPSGSCSATYNGADIWFKVRVPFSGNLSIQKRINTDIQLVMEAYQGDCSSLSPIEGSCLELDSFNFLILQDLTPNEIIYLRAWDNGGDDIGIVELSAHFLPANPADWELCNDLQDPEQGTENEEGASRRLANEFILSFPPGATPEEKQALVDSLRQRGDILLKECNSCSSNPLQLWRTGNPIQTDERVRFARGKGKVDTTKTSFNYIIENVPCTGFGELDRFPPYLYEPRDVRGQVRVGIIDTGVDLDNNLLQNAFWQNEEAVDSLNCLIGDMNGYDFKNNTADIQDVDAHGTRVNGIVVRAFPSDLQLELMNVKFYENNRGTLFDAVCAIYYAIEEGAQILNLSWGFESNEFPDILYDALETARDNGILVVVSAGNTAANNDRIKRYPSNFNLDNQIVVTAYEAATDGSNRQLAHYANFGPRNVDIATIGFLETTDLFDRLISVAGTSVAAPLVSRTAAIVWAEFPRLSYEDVRACILSSTTPVAGLQGKVATGGILNHFLTFDCAREKDASISVSTKEVLEEEQIKMKIFPNPADETVTVRYSLKDSDMTEFNLFDTFGRSVRQWKLEANRGKDQTKILELNNIPKGTYFLQLSSNKKLITQRLIVN